jgi:hypothetical protein
MTEADEVDAHGEDYVEDRNFDAQLVGEDAAFEDPFETFSEMGIIVHNIFDIYPSPVTPVRLRRSGETAIAPPQSEGESQT